MILEKQFRKQECREVMPSQVGFIEPKKKFVMVKP